MAPAVTLAATSVETRIETALEVLATTSAIPSGLWEYVTDRDQYWKQPSVNDQLDVLLRALTGDSLKDEPSLWEAHQNLRKARNALVHTGVAVIGNERVDAERASKLIAAAGDIINWIEARLPDSAGRPQRSVEDTVTVDKAVLMGVPSERVVDPDSPRPSGDATS